MAATATELFGRIVGLTSSERVYKIVGDGSSDESDALAALLATAPESISVNGDTLTRDPQGVEVEDWGTQLWRGSVTYSDPNASGGGGGLDVGESQWTFDTGGGTQHIYFGKETLDKVADDTTADFANAIAVNENGDPGGVDIVSPAFTFEITKVFTSAQVDSTYINTLYSLTGKVNDSTFQGIPARNCLFLGARGTTRGDGNVELTFRFAANPGLSNATVAGIAGVSAGGWDVVWVHYKTKPDASLPNVRIPEATQVNVERVYDSGDFSELNL